MRTMGLILATAMLTAQAGAEPPATPPAATTAEIQISGPVLMVSDLERSLKFYTEGLGLRIGRRLPSPTGPGLILTSPQQSPSPFLLLRQVAATPSSRPAIQQGNGLSRIMLLVPDSAVLAARLDKAGIAHTPLESSAVFFVTDPDGYRFEIMQRNSHH